MESAQTQAYPLWRKLLLTAFILFHWFIVTASLIPRTSPLRTRLDAIEVPLPMRTPATPTTPARWTFPPQEMIGVYLFNTAQWQDWSMFSNPPTSNRYIGATVTFSDGTLGEFAFPRLSQLGFWEAWIEKRYRKFQNAMLDDPIPLFFEDLARYIARRMDEPPRRPVRVMIFRYESMVPRHDQFDRLPAGTRPAWIDYTVMLREKAVYRPTLMTTYEVKQEDLP